MAKQNFKPTPEQLNSTDPHQSVWVSANAGSGKTHVLVERVIRLLLEGNDPSSILCITYTKAAAAEMSVRLFERMGDWAIIPESQLISQLVNLGIATPTKDTTDRARRLFARALETPGGLKIQTIHAFCEKLLQQFPVEASMAPGFKVLDDKQSETLLETAISETLRHAESGQDQTLADAFAEIIDYVNADQFESLMRSFLKGPSGLTAALAANFSKDEYALVLKKTFNLGLAEDLSSVVRDIQNADRDAYRHHATVLARYKIHKSHDTSLHLNRAAESDSTLEHFKTTFLTKAGAPRATLLANQTGEDHPATKLFLENEQLRIFQLLQRHDLLLRIELTANAFVMARTIYHQIERQKKLTALYDFDDLINRTAALLSSLQATQWVLFKIDAGLKHILVDEAQDTSPTQWKIISALCEEFFSGHGSQDQSKRTVFVVGDRKQSIFSFHGADAQGFVNARNTLAARVNASDQKLANIDLTVSYRSTEAVLAAVDQVFPISNPQRFGFAADDLAERPHRSNRAGLPGVFEIWPLVVDESDDNNRVPWTEPVDREPSKSARRLLAKNIAQKIQSWIGKRILEAEKRTVEASDILILLQSRGPLFSMIIAELRKIGVKVAGADRLQLQQSLAIQDLIMMLQWLALPQDDHALACILKSPLVPQPFDDEALMELAIGRGTSSLWSRLQQTQSENVIWLVELKALTSSMSPYGLLSVILSKFRKPMAERLGPEAIDASDALLDQAMHYEMEVGHSVAGFYHWFKSTDTNVKREMEKTTDEIRLMTVHGAKGLEANIVILADAASIPTGGRSDPKFLYNPLNDHQLSLPIWQCSNLVAHPTLDTWQDHVKLKSLAERNRLLYVAMTRACDELYICGIKMKREPLAECWYKLIEAMAGPTLSNPSELWSENRIAAEAKTVAAALPNWTQQRAPIETGRSIFSVTGMIERHHLQNDNSTKRGALIHAILQELPDIASEKRAEFINIRLSRIGLKHEATALVRLLQMPELEQFWCDDSQAEAEIRGLLDDGREVSGRVDRIVFKPNEILVLDYKSDRQVPESLGFDHPYVSQMAIYAMLLTAAYPDKKVRVALLFTQGAKLMWLEQNSLTKNRDQLIDDLELEVS